MGSMSYCRFQNTLSDLLECEQALSDAGADPFAELSEAEARAARALIKVCKRIAGDYGDNTED